MNFTQHSTIGLLGATIYTISAHIFQAYSVEIINNPFFYGVVFYLLSLFPDVDTKSIPQKIFYRVLILLAFFLFLKEYYEVASLLLLGAITPLLGNHRGWTHWKVTPFLLFLLFIFCYDSVGFHKYTLQQLLALSWKNLWLLGAFCLGGWTHLVLDSRLYKKLVV